MGNFTHTQNKFSEVLNSLPILSFSDFHEDSIKSRGHDTALCRWCVGKWWFWVHEQALEQRGTGTPCSCQHSGFAPSFSNFRKL